MLAVVVTVQVQLLVPEFTVTHLLPYLLTIPLWGQSKVQWSESENWLCLSVGYYSTWLWIQLSILSWGAIPQDLCRSLRFSLPICCNCFLNHSTVFTESCDWKNVGHPADLFKGILIDSHLPVTCWHPWSFIVVLTAPKTSNIDLIWKSIWCLSADLKAQDRNPVAWPPVLAAEIS